MGKQTPAPNPRTFDREIIRELARCFARAAVDEMLAQPKPEPGKAKPASKCGGKTKQK
jgi:hypothetical protein